MKNSQRLAFQNRALVQRTLDDPRRGTVAHCYAIHFLQCNSPSARILRSLIFLESLRLVSDLFQDLPGDTAVHHTRPTSRRIKVLHQSSL
jgi:hypothetical protein